MDDNIDFKDLWRQQAVSPPNMEELLSKLKNFKRISMRKLILTNAGLIATCVLYLFIWYRDQPEFISTKIGIVLMILAMVIYLFAYNKIAWFYKTIDVTQNNSDYLQKLISIKTKQKFLHCTMMRLYFILLTSGLCLFMYESACRMASFWAIFYYVVMLGCMGLVWFYIGPKIIKKEQVKIDGLIVKFEAVNKQLEEDL